MEDIEDLTFNDLPEWMQKRIIRSTFWFVLIALIVSGGIGYLLASWMVELVFK